MAKWSKKLKKAAKMAGRKVARAATVGAPILGAAIGGPLGGLIGGGVGAAASRVHQKNDSAGKRRARLKRSLMATGAAVGISGGIAALSGSGLTGSPIAAIGKALGFGGGGAPSSLLGGMGTPSGSFEGAYVDVAGPAGSPSSSPSSWFSDFAKAGGQVATSVFGPTQKTTLGEAFGMAGGIVGASGDGASIPGAGFNPFSGENATAGEAGGMSPAMIAVLAVAALLLFM